MTISYPIAFPSSIKLSSIVPTLQYTNSVTKSPFTNERQAFRWSGEMWMFDCVTIPCIREVAEDWIAFANKLRGKYGTFLFGDKSAGTPRGVGGGTPVVNGGGQAIGSYQLDVKGAPTSQFGWLLKGDYFQIGTGISSRLHKLTENANTDSGGLVTLEFVPALRYSPNDNVAITIVNPVGLFALADNSVMWSVDQNGHYRYNFKAEESL